MSHILIDFNYLLTHILDCIHKTDIICYFSFVILTDAIFTLNRSVARVNFITINFAHHPYTQCKTCI